MQIYPNIQQKTVIDKLFDIFELTYQWSKNKMATITNIHSLISNFFLEHHNTNKTEMDFLISHVQKESIKYAYKSNNNDHINCMCKIKRIYLNIIYDLEVPPQKYYELCVIRLIGNRYYIFQANLDSVVELDCGIDLGIRTFATIYSDAGAFCFGKRSKEHDIQKLTQNKVGQLHFKIAHKILKIYDKIYIGQFDSIQCTYYTQKMMDLLDPVKFCNILITLGKKYGVQVILVNEFLTTQKCSTCKVLNNIGSSKIYYCKSCGLKIDRDINSAKNILELGRKN